MIQKTYYVLATFVLAINCYAQSDIQTAPKSSWIDELKIPSESKVSKYDVKSGVYYKLIDYQVDLEESSYYSHFVYNALSSGGASNISQIEISYDSSYQSVVFHELIIHRKGVTVDRTSEVTFEYIKNEQQLQSNIYTGNVTALAVLEDIRKGDWVEFSYTVKGQNPVFEGSRYYLSILDDVNPVDQLFVKVLFPEEEEYKYRVSDDAIPVDIKSEKGKTALRIDRRDLDAVDLEETTPPWIIPFQYVEVSNSTSWEEVNNWAVSLFDKKESSEIDQVFEEIFYPEFSQEDKINAIIDFVQDEIRYMGIETGMGSIVPFSPNQVIKQRFGDCKDKSLLMSKMMQKIGVDCYPALVNSMLQDNLDNHLPSGHLFDHVIVQFRFDGEDYWLDPTFSYQGGDYKSVTTFDYGKALVVKKGNTELTDMNIEDTVTSTKVIEHLDASSYDSAAKMKVKTVLEGMRADNTRQILEYYSVKELADYYKSFYTRIFSSLYEEDRLKVNDDIDANRIITNESYLIPEIWKEDQEGYEGKYTLTYHPINVYSYITNMSCEKKNLPVYFSYPVRFSQETTIDFVEGLNLDNEEKTYENVAFVFTKKVKLLTPSQVRLEYKFESKTKEIDPADFAQVCKDINEIIDNIPIIFYFSKNKPSLTDLPFNFDFYEIDLKNEPLENKGYYIESVVSNVTALNNVIGILEMKNKNVTAAVLKRGIDQELSKYLDENQSKEKGFIPLQLTIKQFRVTEKIKKKTQKASLEFDYRVSYNVDGKTYEFKLVDTLESEGPNARVLHEQNIRKSIKQLFSNLSPLIFQLKD